MSEADPTNGQQEAKWKRFEKLVFEIQKSFAGTTAIVTLNDHIMGVDSGVERQIDISIRQQVSQFPILVAIDCKDYSEPIDVVDMGAFVTLTTDVRANKGVMVSSNGFTKAAIKIAKNASIDTLTLIDSKSVDWKNYVGIPLLIDHTSIEQYSLDISGVGRTLLPYATEELVVMAMYSDDGALIGTPLEILHRKWNKEQIPHEPGVHRVELGKQVNVEYRGVKSKIDVAAHIHVRQDFYLGPLRVYTQGFHDAQNSSLIVARELRTDSIDAGAIIRGEVPGWKKLDVTDGTTVRASMRLSVSAGYGDEAEFDEETTEPEVLDP
jgi:hypothetical protein